MSNEIAIKIENLSKRYKYGAVASVNDNLRADITTWVKGLWPHRDHRPQTADRSLPSPALHRPSLKAIHEQHLDADPNYFWALKDINLEIKRGEVVGIIGRNGAGKSTLLKILSRITPPTTGKLTYNGRIASLLEVGTGFHRELTGRENVYLNGSILGMKRAEITKKFDEIVAFSEVEKFIDTPVKFYSSGMYVRLAFAVAAHLEPEILILDEVLAVGDATFQKKCLGKMGEVAKGGRTVLFVSHNLTVIASLCQRSLLLQGGIKTIDGPTQNVLASYVQTAVATPGEVCWEATNRDANNGRLRLVAARILCEGKVTGDVQIEKPAVLQYDFEVLQPGLNVCTSIHLFDKHGIWVLCGGNCSKVLAPGAHQHSCTFPADLLNNGRYSLSIILITDTTRLDVHIRDAISFVVHETKGREEYLGAIGGCVRPRLEWQERALG